MHYDLILFRFSGECSLFCDGTFELKRLNIDLWNLRNEINQLCLSLSQFSHLCTPDIVLREVTETVLVPKGYIPALASPPCTVDRLSENINVQ